MKKQNYMKGEKRLDTVIRGTDLHLIVEPHELDIAATLDCGQCFRFRTEEDGTITGVAFDQPLHLMQTEHEVVFYNTSQDEYETIWRGFFALDEDYDSIKRFLSADSVLKKAITFSPGIRVLRQDRFEALISFIISQNNNIPRIKGCIERLCRRFGTRRGDAYSFPDATTLANSHIEDYRELGLGYRDVYIHECAHMVANGEIDLAAISHMELADAREALLRIKGVGIKVAECALLFGFHQLGAFPVDTWIKKALSGFYPKGFPEKFRPVAGIAQQYLFHYIRTAPDVEERLRLA